jgi:hypothetical protein
MASKFNYGDDNSNITDGTTDGYFNSLKLNSLTAGLPVKVSATRELISEKILLSDIDGDVVTNPFNAKLEILDLETSDYFSLNTELQKIDNFLPSTTTETNVTGRVRVGELATGRIYDSTIATYIELDGSTVEVSANDLTVNGFSVIKSSDTAGIFTVGDISTDTTLSLNNELSKISNFSQPIGDITIISNDLRIKGSESVLTAAGGNNIGLTFDVNQTVFDNPQSLVTKKYVDDNSGGGGGVNSFQALYDKEKPALIETVNNEPLKIKSETQYNSQDQLQIRNGNNDITAGITGDGIINGDSYKVKDISVLDTSSVFYPTEYTEVSIETNNWTAVIYCSGFGTGRFIGCASQGGGSRVIGSDDGLNWALITGTPFFQYQTAMYSPLYNRIVLTSINSPSIAYSDDGINWSQSNSQNAFWISSSFGSENVPYYCKVAVQASGNNIATSTDGVDYTLRPISGPNYAWRGVCFGRDRFVLVAQNGVAISTDGINFQSYALSNNSQWFYVVYAKDLDLFCAVSNNPDDEQIMTSKDGISWLDQSVPAHNYECIAYGEGVGFQATAGDGNFIFSKDGFNWTEITVSIRAWSSICYSEEQNKFVSISREGDQKRILTQSATIDSRLNVGFAYSRQTDFRLPNELVTKKYVDDVTIGNIAVESESKIISNIDYSNMYPLLMLANITEVDGGVNKCWGNTAIYIAGVPLLAGRVVSLKDAPSGSDNSVKLEVEYLRVGVDENQPTIYPIGITQHNADTNEPITVCILGFTTCILQSTDSTPERGSIVLSSSSQTGKCQTSVTGSNNQGRIGYVSQSNSVGNNGAILIYYSGYFQPY